MHGVQNTVTLKSYKTAHISCLFVELLIPLMITAAAVSSILDNDLHCVPLFQFHWQILLCCVPLYTDISNKLLAVCLQWFDKNVGPLPPESLCHTNNMKLYLVTNSCPIDVVMGMIIACLQILINMGVIILPCLFAFGILHWSWLCSLVV